MTQTIDLNTAGSEALTNVKTSCLVPTAVIASRKTYVAQYHEIISNIFKLSSFDKLFTF